MKTGLANLDFLRNFSQLPLSNISLFTVLFTADVAFFACFLVSDLSRSGCRHNYHSIITITVMMAMLPYLFLFSVF